MGKIRQIRHPQTLPMRLVFAAKGMSVWKATWASTANVTCNDQQWKRYPLSSQTWARAVFREHSNIREKGGNTYIWLCS